MRTWPGLRLTQAATFLVAAVFAAALFSTLPAPAQSPTSVGESKAPPAGGIAFLLDGRNFNARIVREDADKDAKNRPPMDKLIFSGGKFSSKLCRQYNFTEAPYWVRVEGDQIHFLVELKSPTDGTMLWQGTVRGNTIDGTMRWKKERWYWTIDARHKFRGKLIGAVGATPPPTN